MESLFEPMILVGLQVVQSVFPQCPTRTGLCSSLGQDAFLTG